MAAPVEIFFSYAHEDEPLVQKLIKQLALLQRQGVISAWHDRKIMAGQEWAGAISGALERCKIILLVSDDFLASDYCYDVEMQRALARHDAGDARVIPVMLRPTYWEGAPFAKLQGLPKDMRPVTSWGKRDEAFTDIARGIARTARDITANPRVARRCPVQRRARPASLRSGTCLSAAIRASAFGTACWPTSTAGSRQGAPRRSCCMARPASARRRLRSSMRTATPRSTTPSGGSVRKRSGRLSRILPRWRRGLGVRANAHDLLGTASRVRAALEQGRGWLLILDNAEQPQAIRPFLPTRGEGAILVTSRNPDWPFAAAVPLAPFGAEAAGQFLLSETKQVDTAAAAALAQRLGGLPLALAQAAAFVTRSGSRLADYAKLLEEHHAGT